MKVKGKEDRENSGAEESGKAKKNSKKLVRVVMAAMIVSAVLTAFISVAAAAPGNVTNFTITPSYGIVNATSAYNATVNTTGFTTLNITIPKGFSVANGTMDANEPIATIDVYNASGTHGNITITANAGDPENKINITAMARDGGVEVAANATGIEVNYTAGATISFCRTHFGYSACVNLTLPTPENNGSLNITVPAELNITNCSISIEQFVENPTLAGDYKFTARANGEEIGEVATLTIGKVINFTITPSTPIANVTSAYTAVVNTTEFTTLNITIPAGFSVANGTMDANEPIATIDVYNATGTHGNITIRANAGDPHHKINITAMARDGGVEVAANATGIEVNYTAGATISFCRTHFGYSACVNLTLPTPENNGSLNITVPAELNIRNCSISIEQFVENPAAGDYVFTADGVSETVQILEAAPDLNITEIWVGWPHNCTIFYNVTNIGTANATADHNTTLYVDTNEKALDKVPVNLTPGETHIGNFSGYDWTYTPTWDNMTVRADKNNSVEESDETNNCLTNIWMCGDVDGDQAVTIDDAWDIVSFNILTSEWAADVDRDGAVTIDDAWDVVAYNLNCFCG